MSNTKITLVGPIVGLIGSILALVAGLWGFYFITIFSYYWIPIVGTLSIGGLGMIGAVLGFKGKKNPSGILLIIAGSAALIGSFMGYYLYIFIPFIDAILMLLGGILVLVLVEQIALDGEETPEIIREQKTRPGNKLIIRIGLIISLVGGILVLSWGIYNLFQQPSYYVVYFSVAIFFGALAIIGAIVGFFNEKGGIIITFIIGLIGFILVVVMGLGREELWLFISVLLVLIGGIIGVIGYYIKQKSLKK